MIAPHPDPRWLDAPVSRGRSPEEREAIRRALVAERRAQLATLSDDALRARARGHALPMLPRAELIHVIAVHEAGSELTVRWLSEDLPDECPTCETPLRAGAVCRCGYDDRPATEMELAFVRAVEALP